MSHFHYFRPNRVPTDYDDESSYQYQYFNPTLNPYPNPYCYYYNSSIMAPLSNTNYSSASSHSHSSYSPGSLLPFFNPDPFCVPPTTWAVAEDAGQQILQRLHPTLESDQKRKDVIDFMQTFIGSATGAKLFPYGSVPLKTYLLDGDIDMTALSSTKSGDALASEVRIALEKQQQKKTGYYEIHDVQFIDAEVKIIKCLIQNIAVDISFNQLGGICTLCFLEQVDRLIGKDHLFKRSIILIKAWCYYESRILGAHHGLISTYALETLVLYIFNMFHSSIDGPVAVLYRFLDYFSKFDWDNYCISLNGPIPRAALPDVLDIPDDGWNDVLLSADFLKNCVDMFSVPSKDPGTNMRAFPVKHLNIIDPLKVNNNLGRSVHKGNFYRIRSALRYGARQLGWILSLPGDRLSVELKSFFSNSLGMHGNKYWEGIPITLFPWGVEEAGTSPFTTSSEGNSNVDYAENESSLTVCHADGDDSEDEFNKMYSGFVTNGGAYITSDCSIASCDTDSSSVSLSHCYSPKETDMTDTGHQYQDKDAKLAVTENDRSILHEGDGMAFICSDPEAGLAVDFEESNSLLDLTGDYECHIRSLLHGLNCLGYAVSATPAGVPFNPLSRAKNRYQFESINQYSQFSDRSQRKGSSFSSKLSHQASPYKASSYGGRAADKQIFRGTGTCLPNINHPRAYEMSNSPSSTTTTTLDSVAPDGTDHLLSEAHFPALCGVKFGFRPSESSVGNPYSLSPDELEFGSFKGLQLLGLSTEKNKHITPGPFRESSHVEETSQVVVDGAAAGSCESISDAKLTSVAEHEQVFELEDATEFPPLTM